MKYIIFTDKLEKAEDTGPPERGHKAFARHSRSGKLEQIKQAGVVKGPMQSATYHDKGPEQKAAPKDAYKEEPPPTSAAKVGDSIDVGGGKQAKVTAVGKDGVTAQDDQGQTHQVMHGLVKPVGGEAKPTEGGEAKPTEGGEAKPTEGGEAKPAGEGATEGGHDAEKLKAKYDELVQLGVKPEVLKDVKGVIDQWDKEAKGQPAEHKFSDIKPKSETDAGVIDEFKKMVDYKIEKGWVVKDPKHEGVFLVFTKGPKGENNAAIYYRGKDGKPGDFEDVDFNEAVTKYGKPEMKKELEGEVSKQKKEPEDKSAAKNQQRINDLRDHVTSLNGAMAMASDEKGRASVQSKIDKLNAKIKALGGKTYEEEFGKEGKTAEGKNTPEKKKSLPKSQMKDEYPGEEGKFYNALTQKQKNAYDQLKGLFEKRFGGEKKAVKKGT